MRRAYFTLIICFCAVIMGSCGIADAMRNPEICRGLGGHLISCSIYNDQASFKGIKSDESVQKVLRTLGKPKSVSTTNGLTYYYDGFSVGFVDWGGKGNPTVTDIKVWSGDAGSTLDGVKCGMSETVLTSIYGTADGIYIQKNELPKLSAEQNNVIKSRLDKTIYTYNANPCLSMSFTVQQGVIKNIEIHRAD